VSMNGGVPESGRPTVERTGLAISNKGSAGGLFSRPGEEPC